MISYPAGWTLSVLDHAAAAGAAAADLGDSGVAADDLIVLAGPDARHRMGRLGSSSGVASRIRRTMQSLTMDQMPDLHVYELALDEGHALVGVRIGDPDRRRDAIATIQRHGGHFINRFGDWSTEEIAPWLGPMPDLPYHLKR